jgi:N-acetylglucosamine-6-sulfatase
MTGSQTVESLRVMPNVRRLLTAQGMTFANAVSPSPGDNAARASFLTGRYAHNHGVFENIPPKGGSAKLDHGNTLAVWLQRGGYRTVHVGRYLHGYGEDATPPVPPGWNGWYAPFGIRSTFRYFGFTMNENGTLIEYQDAYQTDVVAQKAVEAIRSSDDEPLFLSVAFLAPHWGGPRDVDDPPEAPGVVTTPAPAPRHRDRFASEPLPRPPSFDEEDVSDKPGPMRKWPRLSAASIELLTERHRQRLESLLAVDEAVAQIVAALEERGQLERTLIVFTSDHGYLQGEHRVPGGSFLPYEAVTRVPLILRGPGIRRGALQRQPVSLVDVTATILGAAGVRAGGPLDGRSLMPLVGDPGVRWGRDLFLGTSSYDALRTPRFLYIRHSWGEEELYDLVQDPDELVSRHADPALAALKKQLAVRLAALKACGGASCRAEPAASLTVRRCRAAVGGSGVARVDFRLGRSRTADRAAPFAAPVRGSGVLRAHLFFEDGRERTLDRRVRCG